MEAAEYWALGGNDDKALKAAAIGFNIILPDSMTTKVDPDFYVMPENELTVSVFLALGTSWRRDSLSGVWQGLDYPSVKTVMWSQGVKKSDCKAVFNGLQVMEEAAINVLNSKLKK